MGNKHTKMDNNKTIKSSNTINNKKSESNESSKPAPNMTDFSIFESEEECDRYHRDVNKCHAVQRILYSLKYYQSLNIKNNKEGQELFIDFIQSLYAHFLNDSIHLNVAHEVDLEEINKSLYNKYGYKHCDILSCNLTARHCRINERNNNNKGNNDGFDDEYKMDPKFVFYQSHFDSLHHFIVHSDELGYRSFKNDDIDEIEWEKEEKKEDLPICFDSEFSRKKENICKKRQHLKAFFNRFATQQQKFNISAGFGDKEGNDRNDESTFLDHLYCSISKDKISALKQYLKNELFDSDALLQDIDQYKNNKISNIYKHFKDKKLMNDITKYIENNKLKKMSFSTGYTFWYWQHYKNSNVEEEERPTFANDNDFCGYSASELYIERGKWDSFKDEILTYSDGEIGSITMSKKKYLNLMNIKMININ